MNWHCRELLLVIAVLLAVGVGVAAAADQSLSPRSLVLQPVDLGAGYVTNKSFSRPRTLQDAASGDSSAIKRRLQRVWLSGYQAGFNARRFPWGVVSNADLFRISALADIERAWSADALAQSGGRALNVPDRMPGSYRLLSRGTVRINNQPLEVLLYMWQRGRVIAVVNITGLPNSFSTTLLARLVARQDLRIREALR